MWQNSELALNDWRLFLGGDDDNDGDDDGPDPTEPTGPGPDGPDSGGIGW